MTLNLRWQGVLVYTVSERAKDNAIVGVRAAVEDGALQVGENAGVPLHFFALEDTAEAHAAVENRVVGKVLVDVVPNVRSGDNGA
jgi:NADPH2:quinone reductase